MIMMILVAMLDVVESVGARSKTLIFLQDVE